MRQLELGKTGIRTPQNAFGAPSKMLLSEHWQAEMMKIENCVECGACMKRCPYGLDIPKLLRKNLADYKDVLSGRVSV